MEFNVLKLKGLIFQHKLTQSLLSEKIGVSKPTVANYFNGRSKIDVEVLSKICDVFNVSPSYFYDGLTDEEPLFKPKKKYLEQRLEELENRVKALEKRLQ